jgi:hypothetical protein
MPVGFVKETVPQAGRERSVEPAVENGMEKRRRRKSTKGSRQNN